MTKKGALLPDCPHCDTASSLEVAWTEMDSQCCVCTCCAKLCRIDRAGRVHALEPRRHDYTADQMFDM